MKSCPTCKQQLSKDHETLIKQFTTKKIIDNTKDILNDPLFRDKNVDHIKIKDLLLLFSGFIIGKLLVDSSVIQTILILIVSAFIVYFLLGEILGQPTFRWYVVTMAFTDKQTMGESWDIFQNKF